MTVSSEDWDLERRVENFVGDTVSKIYYIEGRIIKVEYLAYNLEYRDKKVYGDLMLRVVELDEDALEREIIFSENLEGRLLLSKNYKSEAEEMQKCIDMFSIRYHDEVDTYNRRGDKKSYNLPNRVFRIPLKNLFISLRNDFYGKPCYSRYGYADDYLDDFREDVA